MLEVPYWMVSVVCVVLAVICGGWYVIGWRAGHNAAIDWTWKDVAKYMAGEPVDLTLGSIYTRERVNQRHGSVWEELLNDEEYQRQLKEQEGQDE